MEATKLTLDWNAEPNAPEVNLTIEGNSVTLDFFVNYFRFKQFKEDDKAKITFENCHKYSFNSMNDEDYYGGLFRYKNTELPWGEFYKINSKWENDFPEDCNIINPIVEKGKLNHYIFFYRDNTFECVATGYSLKFYSLQEEYIK